ncbi:MAG: DUF1576 domain-containing protein [Stomatobaculum sp.]|nr:DUF1576 domain-containing protein [Stomatobaculum sp.]
MIIDTSESWTSRIIDGLTIGLSASLFLAAAAGATYTGTWGTLGQDFLRILVTPGPLVTDYFNIGSLPAAFLNAGLCGAVMSASMILLPGPSHVNTLAGYFLVIAHCFYGLNFLNMWPCFLAPFLYLKLKNLDYNQNLHVCMFSTCFSPFVSELLFRYTNSATFVAGEASLNPKGILLTVLFAFVIAFVAPAVLPGVRAWHKGYNLYNGGLAYGMFGFLVFNFLYRTVGVTVPVVPIYTNGVYNRFGRSYELFGNLYFITIFLLCLLAGWYLNCKSFRGLRHLLLDTGYQSNFAKKYGMPLCLINVGLYGLLFLGYINLAVEFTSGAGFTGPTFGVIFAALTFTSMGQHPRNVWPIFLGFPLLSLIAMLFNHLVGGHATWTVSTQAYINSVAFATGLCPIVGRYGEAAGVAAGALCAALCTATGALHGGLMLYNGGFTAGIAALILIPILEHYVKTPRDAMNQTIDLSDMMTLDENAKRPQK